MIVSTRNYQLLLFVTWLYCSPGVSFLKKKIHRSRVFAMHMLWILSLAKSKAELDPAVLGHFASGKAWIQPIQPGRPIAKDAPGS